MGSRLLFNIKEAGEKWLHQGTSCPSHSTASSIDFAEPAGGSADETSQVEDIELEEIREVEGIEIEETHEIKEIGVEGIHKVEEV